MVVTLLIFLLQELTRRIFPLCEDYVLVSQFVESRSHFKNGLVNHALAAALRAFLLVQQLSVQRKNEVSMILLELFCADIDDIFFYYR
jgi:hypothetical protein